MGWRARLSWCAVAGVVLVAPGAAGAKLALISGKLSKPRYTVIALAANGTARTVRASTGRFSLRPPASVVTLQLRAPNGRYAGAIVVGGGGTRVIVGVRAGAGLGKINVFVGKGFARVARTLRGRWVAASRWVRARGGVPIGNGRNAGLVRSKPPRHPPPGDLDADGVPDVLDIDVNGNLILNNLDRSNATRSSLIASQAAWETPPNFVKSSLGEWIWQTANADAAGFTDGQAETGLSTIGYLVIGIEYGGSVELDCGQPQSRANPTIGGLIYCTKGGTGRVFKGDNQCCTPPSAWPRFPDGYDPDGDGFGNLTPNPGAARSGPSAFFLSHGATTAQIGTGDLLIQRVTTNGVETDFPSTIQYVFATVPALVSYSDGQGDSARVSYPVQGPDCGIVGCSPGPGASRETAFPVAAGANGDAVVTVTFWRPQRKPIPGEPNYGSPGAWTDIGRLAYGLGINETANGGTVSGRCPQSSYSATDPNLTKLDPAYAAMAGAGFTDLAGDRPANRGNTLTYKVDLTRCLSSLGLSFDLGQTRVVDLTATACGQNNCLQSGQSSGADSANQSFFFKRK